MDKEKEVIGESDNEEKTNVFQRIKIRLSQRSKKDDKKKIDCLELKCDGNDESNKQMKEEYNQVNEDKTPSIRNSEKKDELQDETQTRLSTQDKKNTVTSNDPDKDNETVIMKEDEEDRYCEKNKDSNVIVRMIRKLSFRKKKGKKKCKEEEQKIEGDAEKKCDNTINNENTAAVINNVHVEEKCSGDVEVEKREEVVPQRPQSMILEGRPPSASGGRPPLPRGRMMTSSPPLSRGRPTTPSSASTLNSRPLSELDSALRQFKVSTAASRESLRNLGSNQDLSQIEEQVRAAVSRSVSRQGSLRRGGTLGREVTKTVVVPVILTSSMEELRRNKKDFSH